MNFKTAAALILYLYLAVREAHAYIDPGTGSYILQIIVAGLLGAAYALKLYWTKVWLFLTNKLSSSKSSSTDEADGSG
ncbi:MAG: hypothetical protein QGF00_01680 [Planctomycetota bacterium]|jgi:hypothetical protein|nr:hypothetical protein [Planctomycetota bacterium]